MKATLRKKISELPMEPGVYLMKDSSRRVVYVGKAKSLKSRVSSYFQKQSSLPLKTQKLVSEISDFSIIVVSSEPESLLLERNLIKHHKPKFNILLRDDKEYPYLRINLKDPWPRFSKVRRRKNDGAEYFGPYANPSQLYKTMQVMYKIFPLVRCSEYEFKNATRPCNYFHIKRCLAPCTKVVARPLYLDIVKSAMAFLRGDNKHVIKTLKESMKQAALSEEFEQAAIYRDQIEAMEHLKQDQMVVSQSIDDAMVFGVYWQDPYMSISVLKIENYNLIENETFIVEAKLENEQETFAGFFMQYFDKREPRGALILPYQLHEPDMIADALSLKKSMLQTPKMGDKLKLIQLANRNALEHHKEEFTFKSSLSAQLEFTQKELKIKHCPHRLECIDISNFGETAIVASNVCFINGQPNKASYRHYNISSVSGKADDYQSIFEVVTRRLERATKDFDTPDVLLIDGGKGQLKAALEAKKAFADLDLDIISIAKSRKIKHGTSLSNQFTNERIFTHPEGKPIELKVGSSSYRLLTSIRDEAHRFAINFHRKKRKSSRQSSILEQVPGIGPNTRKKLLEHFVSLERILSASMEELQKIPGVTKKIAKGIRNLNKQTKAPKQ